MSYRRFFIIAFFCSLSHTTLFAQNEGREFWFTDGFSGARYNYIYSNFYDHSLYNPSLDSAIIYVLGKTYCTGYIENPNTSYHVDFEVQPGVMTKILIPEEVITPLNYGTFDSSEESSFVFQGGSIVIRTTQKVQVWVQTYNCPYIWADTTWYCTTPHSYLGYAYKIALCPTDMHSTTYDNDVWLPNSPMFVIASEDNTQLYMGNDTVLLQQGEVFFSIGCDIATNCKRIIVYKGNYAKLEGSLYHQYCLKGYDFLFRVPPKINFGMEALIANNNIQYITYPMHQYSWNLAVYHYPFREYLPASLSYLYFADSVPYAYFRYQQEPGIVWSYLTNKVFSDVIVVSGSGIFSDCGLWQSDGIHAHCRQPTELMVTNWIWPISKKTYHLPQSFIDTTYVFLTVYVHEDGIGSTYLNGQLIPPSSFDSFPGTNGEYYSFQWDCDNVDTIDFITVENPHGFSAYIHEIGYSYLPSGIYGWGNTMHPAYYMYGSSGFDFLTLPIPHSSLSAINYDTVYRCLGDMLDLMVEHNPDSVPVEWIVDGESYITQGMAFMLTDLDTLTVQCILHYDCPDTTTTFVAVVPPPLVTIAHDTTVCAGATLSVEQPNALSYLWSNGATTPSITVDSAGTFQVSVTNIGCRAESDSFHVSLYGQSAVDFGNDSILCELATLLLDATQQHPAQYFWQDASTNTTYTVYQDGDYWVVITDNCLGASDTINIGYLNDFSINLGPDTMLCEGKTLTLNAEVPYCDYLWQDGSTQSIYLVRGPGTYSVEVSNKCFSHWDAVNVDYEHCAQELYLPNAFTPNYDNQNEFFLPTFSYPDEVEEYRMEIYNRWGTLVFRTEEITFGWDGTNAMESVYAVVVHYKTRGEKPKTVTGSVTVVR